MKETLLTIAALFTALAGLYLAQDLTQSLAADMLAQLTK